MGFFRNTRRRFERLPEWFRLVSMAIVAIVLFAVGGAILWACFMPIPSIHNFENRAVAQSTKIYDRTGNIVLYDVHGTVRRTSVPLEEISPYVQRATIAIEDDTFYTHHGVRPVAILRAVIADIMIQLKLREGYTQGGSTITQQVVKNALLTQDKTITRKIIEMILAVRLETRYSKDEILNTYLNENPYGGTIYGIEEASQYFFGVDAKDLGVAQAAYLAALPQAPTYYSPYGSHKDALEARKNLVLAKMLEHDLITKEEHDEARAEIVQFKDETEAGIKAPHFVFYIREYLEEKYGVDAVYRDGLNVVTTLDYALQQAAEQTVRDYAPAMLRNFNASNQGMVAIEPATGHILAMVGSKGYFDDTIDGKVNVVTASRQPGSSFKPFVYATAFAQGYTPETVVFDVPTQFSTRCAPSDYLNDVPPCYSPSNYDGTFKGPLTLRSALAISENVPSVKTLYLTGVEESLKTARAMGVESLSTDASQYGLSLVLGGGNVTLLEMTGAYAVFGNDGVKNKPTGILSVKAKNGRVLEEYEEKPERVIDSQVARQMNDVLADNVARTPEFGADSPLYFPGYNVADKTGTTNDFRDAWIIGYTPGISVGAWAGNNDNSEMERRIAAFIITPMWHEFMEQALEKYPSDDFIPPAPESDFASLPAVLRGEWNTNPAEGIHDILHWVNKSNPRGGGTSRGDVQYPHWEYPVQLWAAGQRFNGASTTPATSGENFRILSPQPGSIITSNTPTILTAYYAFPQNVTNVTYFVNDVPVGSTNQPPYGVTYMPVMRGPATIRATAQTITGVETSQISVMVQ